jgi:hypothetical protein
LRNKTAWIAPADLFVVPTINLRLLYYPLFLTQVRRELVHYMVTSHPRAEWVARQMTEAFPWDTALRYPDVVLGRCTRRERRLFELMHRGRIINA